MRPFPEQRAEWREWAEAALAELCASGPARVVLGQDGTNVPLSDARRSPTTFELDVVLVARDGTSYGAPKHLEDATRALRDDWVAVARVRARRYDGPDPATEWGLAVFAPGF